MKYFVICFTGLNDEAWEIDSEHETRREALEAAECFHSPKAKIMKFKNYLSAQIFINDELNNLSY